MSNIKVACPSCSRPLQLPPTQAAGVRLRCSACGALFTALAPVRPIEPVPQREPTSPPARGFALGLLLGIFIMLGAATAGVALYFNRTPEDQDSRQAADKTKETPRVHDAEKDDQRGDGDQDTPGKDKAVDRGTKNPPTQSKPSSTEEVPIREDRFDPNIKAKEDLKPKDPPRDNPKPADPPKDNPKPKPPGAADLPPDLQARVNDAIQRGVHYLKESQKQDGTWTGGAAIGVTALAALTLLECGVPANAPEIEKAVKFVRTERRRWRPIERTAPTKFRSSSCSSIDSPTRRMKS